VVGRLVVPVAGRNGERGVVVAATSETRPSGVQTVTLGAR